MRQATAAGASDLFGKDRRRGRRLPVSGCCTRMLTTGDKPRILLSHNIVSIPDLHLLVVCPLTDATL
jgi:hypothetical protein